jgi:hypothetical protein
VRVAFIVTSAINTRFGVFSADDRIKQTIDTINSIKARCPEAYVIMVEMAGVPITAEQKALIQPSVNLFLDFSTDPVVQQIYKNPNWDVVKSSTELMCFGEALNVIVSYVKDIDRIFKVSGRYLLNEDFNIYDYADKQDKIVFAKRKQSQFPAEVTGGVKEQYMSRCWSFPAAELEGIAKMFVAMRKCMFTIVKDGGYIDIEHLLFLYSNPAKVIEVNTVGVQGLLGPNGTLVRD